MPDLRRPGQWPGYAAAVIEWAAKIALPAACAQEVREFGSDPELGAMLRRAGSRR